MEHALRDHARLKFSSILGALNSPVVRNAERSVYNWAVQQTKQMSDEPAWDNRTFRWRYKHKLLHLLAELKRDERVAVTLEVTGDKVNFTWKMAPQLVSRLLRKELETKTLARYDPEVLWPDGPRARAAFALKTRDLMMEASRAKEQDYEGQFKCGKCKSTKTTYYQMQTRSADEPMVRFMWTYLIMSLINLLTRSLSQTTFVTCTTCSNRCKC